MRSKRLEVILKRSRVAFTTFFAYNRFSFDFFNSLELSIAQFPCRLLQLIFSWVKGEFKAFMSLSSLHFHCVNDDWEKLNPVIIEFRSSIIADWEIVQVFIWRNKTSARMNGKCEKRFHRLRFEQRKFFAPSIRNLSAFSYLQCVKSAKLDEIFTEETKKISPVWNIIYELISSSFFTLFCCWFISWFLVFNSRQTQFAKQHMTMFDSFMILSSFLFSDWRIEITLEQKILFGKRSEEK